MKTVFYKFAGFALSDDALRSLRTRIIQKCDKSYVEDPKNDISFEAGSILMKGRKCQALLGVFIVHWPDDHPRAAEQWFLIVRPEPSLMESLNNFTEVPLVPDEEEEDKRAVEWLKQYNYSDEEIKNMWTTVPRQWIIGIEEYPLHY